MSKTKGPTPLAIRHAKEHNQDNNNAGRSPINTNFIEEAQVFCPKILTSVQTTTAAQNMTMV
jgi:hypothetical protein